MITSREKLNQLKRMRDVMRETYPKLVQDWRITQLRATYRLQIMDAIIRDYEQQIATEESHGQYDEEATRVLR